MKSQTLFLIIFGSTALAIYHSFEARQSNWTIGQTVQTESGAIIGHAAPNATAVSEYLGVPYGRPPIGDLRFAAPVKYSSSSTLDASSFGPGCLIVVQKGKGNTSNPANLTSAGFETLEDTSETTARLSEDCLNLNVWAKPQIGESKKAVMVWIYGGSFTEGYTGDPQYNGQYIADYEDVVVVSLNYRVNIFGFPGAGTYNVGLLDQRLAIEWVRDNIVAFGGDPNRITLFGQSAGGASIDYYSYAWTSDPIVNAFIEESGTTQTIIPLNQSTSAEMWYNVSATVGCGGATSNATAVLSCMRTVNSSLILAAVGRLAATSSNTAAPPNTFTPVIDSEIVFPDYPFRSLSGNFIKAPILMGNNDNEAGVFRVGDILAGNNYSPAYYNAFNLNTFVCPCSNRANISVYNKVPTWRYRWFGVFPNTNLTTFPDSGAYHGSEIPIVFNTMSAGKGIMKNTLQETAVSSYVMGAWAAFAKDPVKGLENYQGGWPEYDPAAKTLLRLGFNAATGVSLAMPSEYDSECTTQFTVTGTIKNETSTSISSSITSTSTEKSEGVRVLMVCYRKWMLLSAVVAIFSLF